MILHRASRNLIEFCNFRITHIKEVVEQDSFAFFFRQAVDCVSNKLCTQFLSTFEKGLFFFISSKEIFTSIKLVFLFRCQVGKVNFVCLPLPKFLMGIDTFVLQCPLAEAVKCAAYLLFGSFRFIHGIHLLSQPRKRVEFSLS